MKELKSKFNKGETIHYMQHDKPCSNKIVGISYYTGNCESTKSSCNMKDDEVTIILHTGSYSDVKEEYAFKSKDMLRKSLFDE